MFVWCKFSYISYTSLDIRNFERSNSLNHSRPLTFYIPAVRGVNKTTLYRYFAKTSTKLPNPNGDLSASVSPAAIKEANEAVESAICERKSKRRVSYSKFSPEQRAEVRKYASINGNQAAIRHFFKQLGVDLKVNSVQTWKTKYVAELNRKRKAGETDDLTVKALPVKKLMRPLLGENNNNNY